MQNKIVVLENGYPVTRGEAVYVNDSTTLTEYLANNGNVGGGGQPSEVTKEQYPNTNILSLSTVNSAILQYADDENILIRYKGKTTGGNKSNPKIQLLSKNRFPNLAKKSQSYETNALNISTDGNGVFSLNGANTTQANFSSETLNIPFEIGNYVVKVHVINGSIEELGKISFSFLDVSNGWFISRDNMAKDFGFKFNLEVPKIGKTLAMYVQKGTFNNTQFKLSIERGDYPTKYDIQVPTQEIQLPQVGDNEEIFQDVKGDWYKKANDDTLTKINSLGNLKASENCTINIVESNNNIGELSIMYKANQSFNDFNLRRNDKGSITETQQVNPEWWGWNLPDGDAFFRYNCDKNIWTQYKEVDGAMLVRGMLVVGKGKNKFKDATPSDIRNQIPARYGFHIFEGVGYEEDHRRVTILGGRLKDTCAIFYFKTPYDGTDQNLQKPYGWVQIGSDMGKEGMIINNDNSRFYTPIVFSKMPNDVETTQEKETFYLKHYDLEAYQEDKYPNGTMYFNHATQKLRVKSAGGWKSVVLEP